MSRSAVRKAVRKQALLLLVWASATVLLPLVHSIGHELDHVHGPGGAVKVDWAKILLGPERHETHHHDSPHPHAHNHPGDHVHAHPRPGDLAHGDTAPEDMQREEEHPAPHGEGAPEHFDAWFDFPCVTVLPAYAFGLLSPSPRVLPHDTPELRAQRSVDQARAPPSLS